MATCVFCPIVAAALAAGATLPEGTVVWADRAAVAFLDRRPLFPGHVLVVPTRHIATLVELDAAELAPFFAVVQRIAAVLPSAMAAEGTFVAMNNVVSQSVPHLHVHVVPRRRGDGLRGFFWPRTAYGDGDDLAVARSIRLALGSSDS